MPGKRILIIEDNPTNRKLIEMVLRRAGYDPVSAEDGESGVEIAARLLPDAILMDIQLPKMDGREATRLLRINPRFRHTPIIALTGQVQEDERDSLAAAGFNGHISKPINLQTFPDQVKAYIQPIR